MPREIDFAHLSLLDALDLAVLIEDEAKERYEEFAQQMELHHTPDAARFFSAMAVNETKHRDELNERRTRLFGNAPRTVTRDMLWDVEAPGFEQAEMFMSARRAMEVALECEVKAHDYFAAALPHVKDPDVKALFDELRLEEVEHQDMVKAVMDKLPAEPELSAEGYADPPISH